MMLQRKRNIYPINKKNKLRSIFIKIYFLKNLNSRCPAVPKFPEVGEIVCSFAAANAEQCASLFILVLTQLIGFFFFF